MLLSCNTCLAAKTGPVNPSYDQRRRPGRGHRRGRRQVPTDESHLVVRALRAAGRARRVATRACPCAATTRSRTPGASARRPPRSSRGRRRVRARRQGARRAARCRSPPSSRDMPTTRPPRSTADWSSPGRRGRGTARCGSNRTPALAPVVLVPGPAVGDVGHTWVASRQRSAHRRRVRRRRCALAVHALTARPDLLLPATEDRLHQDYRESAWPDTMRMVRELRETVSPQRFPARVRRCSRCRRTAGCPTGSTRRASPCARCRSTGRASRFIRRPNGTNSR